MKNYIFLYFLISTIAFISCNPTSNTESELLIANPTKLNEEVCKLLKEQLVNLDTSKNLVISGDTLLGSKQILSFYKKNNFNIVWSTKGKANKQRDSLISIIKNADVYGLNSEAYHLSKINSLLNAEYDSSKKLFDVAMLKDIDLLMCDAFFRFLVEVSKGRLNSSNLIREWHPEKVNVNLIELLNTAIKNNTIRGAINFIEPQNQTYTSFKLALANFKIEFKNSNWDSLKSRESDSLTFNKRLKNRLYASHDYFYEYAGSDSVKLVKAIKNFQCKHNLTEDGKIGKLTFKALQQTKEDYIHQIEMNIERCRMLDFPKQKTYVWINIPKYEMCVLEEDTLVLKSKIIVGQPTKQTPLIKSTIRYFIIYPYWTVPFSIATKEILPVLKRDRTYLHKKNFDVLDRNNGLVNASKIDWKKYSKNYFPWKLRQRIGADNSLGVLKFNFINKYGVYLHDTDNHKLFNREMRALSHGCIRLEKYLDFAKFLIRDDSLNYPIDSFMKDLKTEKQKYIYIKKAIPIYVNYFTIEVGKNNELLFLMDVYNRDKKMLESLSKR